MTVDFQSMTKDINEKFKNPEQDIEVQELRLFLKKGRLLWVEPIDPPHHPKAKGKYTVDIVKTLREEKIRQVTAVAFQQDSPACSYWYVYETKNGIEKICLRP